MKNKNIKSERVVIQVLPKYASLNYTVAGSISINQSIYIYIYIERERERRRKMDEKIKQIRIFLFSYFFLIVSNQFLIVRLIQLFSNPRHSL